MDTKKRGRKPKQSFTKNSTSAEIIREHSSKKQIQRGRRKKCKIDTFQRLVDTDDKVSFSTASVIDDKTDELHNDYEESQLSFGLMNIVVKKAPQMDKKEIRKMFDEKFEISSDHKVSNILIQEEGQKLLIKKTATTDTELESVNTNTLIPTKKIYKVLDREEWPKQTDVLCWWCCHSFDTEPVPCPISHNPITNVFEVRGNFCGWSCVSAYSIQNFKSITNVYKILKQLYQENNIERIAIAPDKIVLKSFGGYMDIDEYRALNNHIIKISTDYISYNNQEILEVKKS